VTLDRQDRGRAASYDDTDWTEILRLYDLLVSIAPSSAAGALAG